MLLNIGDRVDVYRNLTKNTFSIRKKGKVVEYSDSVYIHNPIFVVSEKSRQRVLKNRQKNVHAVVRGEFRGFSYFDDNMKSAIYNPYHNESFVDSVTGLRIDSSDDAFLKDGKVYYK